MSAPEPIRPQPGTPQEWFLASPADIAIAGGSAGGGKTWALLMEPLRHIGNPNFGAVIFRRSYTDIKAEGGLWDASYMLYPQLGAEPNMSELTWRFPSGAKIKFAHLQYERDKLSWKGAQIPLIAFDQIEEFTEGQFWYLLSRNRSTCGVVPYIRATCNPVPDDDPTGGWLNRLVSWWLDPETGYAIDERSGVVRWFVRVDDRLEWGEDAAGLRARFRQEPLSFSFVRARLEDNAILQRKDPLYWHRLNTLPLVERERLLHGNWKIRPSAGRIFDRSWFEEAGALPADSVWVRYWDKAGTEGAGALSAGVKMGWSPKRQLWFISDATYGHWGAMAREAEIRRVAKRDGRGCRIVVEQEPGSGGKESAEATILMLAGYDARKKRETGDKFERAMPMSAQAEARNIKLYRNPAGVGNEWIPDFLEQAQRFGPGRGLKDIVDAAVGAFNHLQKRRHVETGAMRAGALGSASLSGPSPNRIYADDEPGPDAMPAHRQGGLLTEGLEGPSPNRVYD